MKKFKVYYYTKHNPNLQSGVVEAETEAKARKAYELTGCDVDSVGEVGDVQTAVERCVCFEFAGDNPDCPIHGHGDDSTAWDKERDELRTMGQGG